jgi:hypothetical protein
LTEKRLESDGKRGGKSASRARKVPERKIVNMHLLEAGKARFKCDGKKGGKMREGREK